MIYKGYGKCQLYDLYSTGKWLTIIPTDDVGRYYLYRFNWLNRFRMKCHVPTWDIHISVVRGEVLTKNESEWPNLSGRECEFLYSDITAFNGKHLWLEVASKELLNIREYFGLPRNPEYPLHMTIGYLANYYEICP